MKISFDRLFLREYQKALRLFALLVAITIPCAVAGDETKFLPDHSYIYSLVSDQAASHAQVVLTFQGDGVSPSKGTAISAQWTQSSADSSNPDAPVTQLKGQWIDGFEPAQITYRSSTAYHRLVISADKVSYFGSDQSKEARDFSRPAGVVFEDALPILIRELAGSWIGPGQTKQAVLGPSLRFLALAQKPFAWQSARVMKMGSAETLSTAFGPITAWHWRIVTPLGGTADYWVEQNFPHRILKWTNVSRETATLIETRQTAGVNP